MFVTQLGLHRSAYVAFFIFHFILFFKVPFV